MSGSVFQRNGTWYYRIPAKSPDGRQITIWKGDPAWEKEDAEKAKRRAEVLRDERGHVAPSRITLPAVRDVPEPQPDLRPDEPEPVLPGRSDGGVEPAPVKAAPTMSPEEETAWRANLGKPPASSKPTQKRQTRSRMFELKGPAKAPEPPMVPAPEPEPEPAPSEQHSEPEAPLKPPMLSTWEGHKRPAEQPKAAAVLPPECSCEDGWWDDRRPGTRLLRSSSHQPACAMHAHHWRLPSKSSDGAGTYVGVCECGATKDNRPYAAEANAGLTARAAAHRKAVWT